MSRKNGADRLGIAEHFLPEQRFGVLVRRLGVLLDQRAQRSARVRRLGHPASLASTSFSKQPANLLRQLGAAVAGPRVGRMSKMRLDAAPGPD